MEGIISKRIKEIMDMGFTAETIKEVLTYMVDEISANSVAKQEEEEKEELIDELMGIVDGGLREGYWDRSFVAAAMTLYLLGDYENRSVQEIKELIKWGEKRFK